MPPPAWTAPPATNTNASGMASETLAEIPAVQLAPRHDFVAFPTNEAQRLQPVDRELAGKPTAIDNLTNRGNQIRLPLEPQQVITQVIAERTTVVGGARKELVDARSWPIARHHVQRFPRQIRVAV